MIKGYCYESTQNVDDNEAWDIGVYQPTGSETFLRRLRIDGSLCDVFRCSDGLYRAQIVNRC